VRVDGVMNKLLRSASVALGLTTIYLIRIIDPLLENNHDLVYHWCGRPLVLFGPIVLNVLIVWAVLTLLLLSVQAPGRGRAAVWGAIILFTPSVILKDLTLLPSFAQFHWGQPALAIFGIVAFSLLLLLWRPAFAAKFDHVVGFVSTVLQFVAISGAILLFQVAKLAWQARSLNDPLPLHHSQSASIATTKPRIIWVILDELSYQQIYVNRYPGLQLPAFDALADQATIFTHVIPASIPIDANIRTEKIVPALLMGKPVDALDMTPAGQLSTHNPDTGAWQPFNQHDTVFQDALDDGYSTAAVGWYNPYCRLMPAVLDHCYWTFEDNPHNGMFPGRTLMGNLPQPILSYVLSGGIPRILQRFLPKEPTDINPHIEDYRNLSDAADQVLRDRSADFVFLHFPIPHLGGIYNRKTGQLTTGPSTYIDNLALTDKYLAHLKSTLEQSGQWDSSTVVIMGDHSWRTMDWKGATYWTAEEQSASLGGQFDPRPAYIVKFAGQQKGTHIDTPFAALNTRKLLDALLTQKVRSADDLSVWAQQSH
jgi:hypothetical protein